MPSDNVILRESFAAYGHGAGLPPPWWAEGGERIWIDRGRLRVKADPPGTAQPGHVATVWHRQELQGDVQVDFDAQVIASSLDANNINIFLHYSDPQGTPLHQTRAARADGAYAHYHTLNGYIFTFLNDFQGEAEPHPDGTPKGRFRIRRCPGFRLLSQTHSHHCRRGVTYHLTVTKRGHDLAIAVDGEVHLTARDERPLSGVHLGLRTFQTDLWWDEIKVTQL